jgi:flagellar hook-length control protein FliK
MPAAAPVISIATSTTVTSTNPFMGGMGLANGQAGGLFMSLLGGMGNAASMTGTQATDSTTKFGSTGQSLDPALLVLPQSLSNMTQDELTAFFASIKNAADGQVLNDKLLQSLTPGTPAADAIQAFLDQAKANDGTMLDSTTIASNQNQQDNPLSTTGQDILAQSHLLLGATGLTPTEMDQLKKILDNQILSQNLLQDTNDASAATEAAAAASLALVVFVTPPPVTVETPTDLSLVSSTDAMSDMDLINFANLALDKNGKEKMASAVSGHTSIADTAASSSQSEPGQASPFDLSLEDTLSGMAGQSAEDAPSSIQEFKGSLASLDKAKADAATSTITGQIDKQSNLFGGSHIPSTGIISNFNESSLLSANGTTLTASQSTLTNPLLTNPSASSAHPTVQTVAVMIEKAAASGNNQQTLSVQLDPPELGRVQIQLSYEKGEPMKVHLLAEKEGTLALLQRDSHALKSALDQAGVQMDSSSMSFDLASGDQSFNQMLGGSQDGNNFQNSNSRFSLDVSDLTDLNSQMMDTKLDFVPDSVTGNVHYSLLV